MSADSIPAQLVAMQDRERTLQAILDNVPAKIGYWNRELLNGFANNAYRAWFGLDPATLPGKHIREVIGEERYLANLPHIEAVLRGETQLFEREIPSPDGQRMRHSLTNYIPDVVNGEVRGFYVLVSDVTTIKETERRLQVSEDRYRAVLEDQTELISRLRADGSYLFVNEAYCRFFGRSRTDLIGSCWHPIAHPDDVLMIERALTRLSRDCPVVTVENRVFSASGELRWMQFVNRGFFDATGKLLEFQSVGRDITERKAAEAQARLATEQLEQRVAERTEQLRKLAVDMTLAEEKERQMIAQDLHDDLGQLLHVVKIKLEMLMSQRMTEEDESLIRQIGHLVRDASSRVRSLTTQLSPPVLERLGLVPALYWLAAELGEAYGIDVQVLDDGSPKQFAPVQAIILFRCARELLINVVKHADCAEAQVVVTSSEGSWVLQVSDSGKGCSDLDAAAVTGGGFGLSSIRERIAYLNGQTRYRSVPGEGSEVTLSIPQRWETAR